MRRGTRAAVCIALLGLLAFVAPAAADEPPSYGGGMTFRAITGVDGPEEFSWRVELDPDQELVEVDDQLAEVRYEDGHRAFTINPTQAHDSYGSTVPTSLRVSATDLITLTVHHRAGNPAAGAAPFAYPVSAGSGWVVGPSTVTVLMPPAAPVPAAIARCEVPELREKSLKGDRRRLNRAGCTLGRVRGARTAGARVVKQSAEPGTSLPAGAKVHVKLG